MAISVRDLPAVDFIDGMTLEKLQKGLIERYQYMWEKVTGAPIVLQPSDSARLRLNADAVYIFQGFMYIQRSGEQNMIGMSWGESLEQLAALLGIEKHKAKPATCTVRFALQEARTAAVSIPEGTRVSVPGNAVYFATTEYAEVAAGSLYVDVTCSCTVTGGAGNGYAAGSITELTDRVPYIGSVSNTTASAGGSDLETDDELAERVFLAPSAFSTAGPDEAYVYHCKAYNPDIDDVFVDSSTPGVVEIYITMAGGTLPEQEVINGLEEYLSDEPVRPFTDYVVVAAPDVYSYDLEIQYWINRSDISRATEIQVAVETAVDAYIAWQQKQIGRDLNPDELIKRVVNAGAKRVRVISPVFTKIETAQIAIIQNRTVNYRGVEDD